MPVFVTHADTAIGVALVHALVADGADVRAFATGDGDVAAVRGAGAIVAVGDHDDEGHIEAAMTHAHTVVVPRIGWMTPVGEVQRDWPTIMRAAVQAEVARIVMVSLVGADRGSDVPLLAALGAIEDDLADATPQTLVVRTDGIDTEQDDVAAVLDGADGCANADVAPVGQNELVTGLVTLDAARSGMTGGHALFTALGPVRPLTTASPAGDGPTSLVGRRWMPPDRRDGLVRAICERPTPGIVGANLWDLTS